MVIPFHLCDVFTAWNDGAFFSALFPFLRKAQTRAVSIRTDARACYSLWTNRSGNRLEKVHMDEARYRNTAILVITVCFVTYYLANDTQISVTKPTSSKAVSTAGQTYPNAYQTSSRSDPKINSTFALKKGKSSNLQHVLFIGDSMSRFLYLTIAYALHFNATSVPKELVQDKLSVSCEDFFKLAVNMFNGSMSCDCYRPKRYNKRDFRTPALFTQYKNNYALSVGLTSHENRQYRHPGGNLFLTYTQLFGDNKMFGTIELQNLHHGTVSPMLRSQRWKSSLLDFLKRDVYMLQPPVTHIVLNSGLWLADPNERTSMQMPAILEAAVQAAPVAVWRETSPKRDEISNPSLTRKNKTDAAAKALCNTSQLLPCIFLPFPFTRGEITDDDYSDYIHFKPRASMMWARHIWNAIRSISVSSQDVLPQL